MSSAEKGKQAGCVGVGCGVVGGVVVAVSVVVLVVVCDDQLSGRPTARLVWLCLSTVADTSKCGNFRCLANSGLLRAVLANFMRNRVKDLNHGGEDPASYIPSVQPLRRPTRRFVQLRAEQSDPAAQTRQR